MLKSYSEYNNCELIEESFFDWLNQKAKWKATTRLATASSIVVYVIDYMKIHDPEWGDYRPLLPMALIIICGVLNIPLTLSILKRILRKVYNKGAMSLWNINRKVKKAQKLVENNPELEDRLNNIKITLREAINREDEKLLKRGVSNIFRLSRDLKRRRKYKEIFSKTNKELEKEAEIKKVDPYGEEQWDDSDQPS